MELCQEILIKILEKEEIHITFPELKVNVVEVLASECYQTLQKIKAVIEDGSLDDPACFMKIEQIINLFEALGSTCGDRHDFG